MPPVRADAGRLGRLLGYAWAAPCTLLGLALALPAVAFAGARWRCVQGVIEVAPGHGAAATAHRGGFVAITLGHVVLGRSAAHLCELRVHEHAHVAQFERWGAVLLLAYPLAGAWQWLRGRRAYLDNPFEVQARRAERRAGAPTKDSP